jgi:hypothetical protein
LNMHDTRRRTSIHHLIRKRYNESFDMSLALFRLQGYDPLGKTAEQPPRFKSLICEMNLFLFECAMVFFG